MTRRLRRAHWITISLCFAAGVIFLLFGFRESRPVSGIDEDSVSQEESPSVQQVDTPAKIWRLTEDIGTEAHNPPVAVVLPNGDLPFGDQYDALLKAHESGSTEASCRLVQGITECAQLQRSMEFVRARQRGEFPIGQAEADGVTGEAIVAVLAHSLNYLERRAAACEGFVASQAISANEVLRTASRRLSPAQKTLMAMTRPDGQIRRLNPPNRSYSQSNMYVYPQFMANHVLEFLEAGFRARNPLALEGLALLHAPGNAIPAQGTWPALPDPSLYARYAILLQELAGPEVLGWAAQELIAYSLASLTPDEVEQVRGWVARELPHWRLASGSVDVREQLRELGRTASTGDHAKLCRP